MLKKKLLINGFILASLCSTHCFPSSYGINYSYVLVDQEPANLHAYRISGQYYPASWVWAHWQIFLDAGFGHWWVTHAPYYTNLNIYSIAPIFRCYFFNSNYISPFVDLSIGLSYLTKTHLSDKNLGIHFSFQDQISLGASFGPEKKLSASLTAIHYSNGSLSSNNSGITAPVMLNLSYRF